MNTKNLLIVDDSATARTLISMTLNKSASFRVLEASDGNEALACLESEPIDLVLTDIQMPNMNGLDLISQIRSSTLSRQLPIIVITTKGEEADRDRGLSLGANAYISKPISGSVLQGLVKELLA